MTRNSNNLPTMFTHLQGLYNEEANMNKHQERQHKQLYYKLIESQNAQNQEIKNRERYLNKLQNNQIGLFWQNEQSKRQNAERRRRQQLCEANQVNKSMTQSLANNKVQDNYEINDDYAYYIQRQVNKKREQNEQMQVQRQYLDDVRRMQEQQRRSEQLQTFRKKQLESSEANQKRELQLKRIKDKHQQNMDTYGNYDLIMKQRKIQQELLDDYVVNKGAHDLQVRVHKMQMAEQDRTNARKNQFISGLRSQVQEDELRNYHDRKNMVESEKKIMDNRYKYYHESQSLRKLQKSLENKKHLQILHSQFKPRKLLSEKEPIEDAGIGSPVHIGKVINDDRRRQLEWIQRSLQKELFLQ